MGRVVIVAAVAAMLSAIAALAATPIHTMAQLRKTRVRAVVAAPGFPDWIAPGFEYVWLANGHAIERIDPKSNKRRGYVAAGTQPCEGLATGFGSLWTVNCPDMTLLRIDPGSGKVSARIQLPGTALDGEGLIAVDGNAVWVPTSPPGQSSSELVRVDPSTDKIAATITLPGDSSGAAAGFGSVWVTGASTGVVSRVDPATNKVAATVKLGGSPRFIAAGAGGVWALNQTDGSVYRIDPSTNKVAATVKTNIPGNGGCIAAALGRVWVTMPGTPFSEINPQGNEIVGQWLGSGGDCITTGFGSVWLVNHDLKNVWRITPRP